MRNPTLFRQLQALFGTVRIANEGAPFQTKALSQPDGTKKIRKISGGEEYHVCCPFCGDKRYRLYVNHAWGLDAQYKLPTSQLVICHNEHCEDNEIEGEPFKKNPKEYIRAHLKPYLSDIKMGLVRLKTATVDEENAYSTPLEFPKEEWCTRLDWLPSSHPAAKYLAGRRFNPVLLARDWGVVYANKYPVTRDGKEYGWLAGRLFIPTTGGWQARDVTGGDKVKYFSCPGWKKSRTVYNIERARNHKLAVLCEGVTDVWRVGMPGICIFGKLASKWQLEQISANFTAVAVLLHEDAFEVVKPGKVPDGRATVLALRRTIPTVFTVRMPDGKKDAAECDEETVWRCIKTQADKNKIFL
jgi:hypothetical protein